METPLDRLRKALPPEAIDTSAEATFRASLDNLRLSRCPEAVISPADEDGVAAVLALANEYHLPLTTRGAGSATTGAATPAEGGWVIDLSAWKQLAVREETMSAFVQPGVTVKALDDAAAGTGLAYPPDPGSARHATLGGTIACNAGGLRGAKYGVTRDYVMGLEGFLPTGEFVRWGGNLRKFACGYNIRDLWIGSEGTLGIITGAILRLIPRPAARRTTLLAYKDEHAALAAAAAIRARRVIPSILEFLDRETVAATLRLWGRVAPEKLAAFPASWAQHVPALLLVETDGEPAQADAEMTAVLQAAGGHATHRHTAASDDEAETLWTVRRGCSQAMFELGDTKLNEDVVLPLDAQTHFFEAVDRLRHETGLPMPTFGHAADGNFHVHIMYDAGNPAHRDKARDGTRRLMEQVVALDGAISGEHGIGLAKSPFMQLQHGTAELSLMKRIKETFDPNNILNPGKLLEPFEIWNHPRTKVRLPWDH
ncbi:MAG: FAD-binding protein [Opitutales bacterium]|nr:FAD-binding protein [Opitutales bacterium]